MGCQLPSLPLAAKQSLRIEPLITQGRGRNRK
jgi:hypothetical protein